MTNNVSDIASHNPEAIIVLDWDIHQLIEQERRGFEEAPVAALRRLLGLDKPEKADKPAQPQPRQRIRVKAQTHRDEWTDSGIVIPNGTVARFTYRRGTNPIYGEFKDGKLHATGKIYDTLSEAANDLATTRKGKKTRLNGWLYWQVKPEGSENWVIMDKLRKAK